MDNINYIVHRGKLLRFCKMPYFRRVYSMKALEKCKMALTYNKQCPRRIGSIEIKNNSQHPWAILIMFKAFKRLFLNTFYFKK